MERLIYDTIINWIEDVYGTGEACDPCYNIEYLSKILNVTFSQAIKEHNTDVIEFIKEFLASEKYCAFDTEAIANNYIELLNKLEGGE
jgi:hypothetical protein